MAALAAGRPVGGVRPPVALGLSVLVGVVAETIMPLSLPIRFSTIISTAVRKICKILPLCPKI